MLEKKDLEDIRSIMKEELAHTENMILEEMDRMQERIDERINKVESNLEEIKQYYRINKLEQENTTMLLEMIKSLQREVDELKRKIA